MALEAACVVHVHMTFDVIWCYSFAVSAITVERVSLQPHGAPLVSTSTYVVFDDEPFAVSLIS